MLVWFVMIESWLQTLSNASHTILRVRAELADTMPVDTSSIPLHVVVDGNLDVISPVRLHQKSAEAPPRTARINTHPYQRSRILSINQEALPFIPSIRITSAVRNSKGIISRDAGRRPLLIKICVNAVSVTPAVSGRWGVGAAWVRLWVDCEGGSRG